MELFENNFPGSFADENVKFQTTVVKTKELGGQYWKPLIFVEKDRFVDAEVAGTEDKPATAKGPWQAVPGLTGIYAVSVGAEDAMTLTTGLLQSWLSDLFLSGFSGECILVAFAGKEDTADDKKATLTDAYEEMKMYGYFKSICTIADGETEPEAPTNENLDTDLIIELARLCGLDNEFISSVPFLPFYAEDIQGPDSSALYTALNAASADVFMSAYSDPTRNAALYALGLAMSELNGSATCVGNSFDMWQTSSIGSSGPAGRTLNKNVRKMLNAAHIQTWKPVGDNTALVAAEGAESLRGTVIAAQWVIAYITYMSKVGVAKKMTQPNYFHSEAHYREIIGVLAQYLAKIGQSGRIEATLTVPAYNNLPKSQDSIIIKDAWKGVYKDVIRNVEISGKLYIGMEE